MNKQDNNKKTDPEPLEELADSEEETGSQLDDSEEIEIIVDPPKKRPKSGKSQKKTKSQPKKPSDEEILSRLMEKNQTIVKLNKKILEIEKYSKDIEDKY